MNKSNGLDEEHDAFCIYRINTWSGKASNGPIPVYMINRGYMLQFNHDYTFAPQEMEH